jgi:hypothetical protein
MGNHERGSFPRPGQEVLLKENAAPQIRTDAELALAAAREARQAGDVDNEASFARIATLLYFVMLEALINFVYEWSEVQDDSWRSWSIATKWLKAAEQCRPGLGLAGPFDSRSLTEDVDLFQQFRELKEVRNSMVHSQAVFTVLPEHLVSEYLERLEFYQLTGFPRRLALFRYEHAETAREIAIRLSSWLDRCLEGASAHLHDATSVVEFVGDDPDSNVEEGG